VRFIRAVVNEDIVIRKVKRNDLIKLLLKEKFDPMSKLENLRIKTASEKAAEIEAIDKTQEQGEAEETELESASESNKPPVPAKEFDYLLSLPLWSLTYERVIELENQMKQKEKECDALSKMELTTMWIDDMDHFIEVLDEYEQKEEEERLMANKIKKGRGTKAEGKAKGGKKKDKGNKKDNKENKQNKPKTQIDNELNDSISINGGEELNAFDLMKSANKGKDNKPFKVDNKRKDSDVPLADPKHKYQLSKKRKLVENVDDSFDEFIMNYENKSKIL
jgi:DNA topoisomerase-2